MLQIEHLSKVYSDRKSGLTQVLHDIHLSVEKKSITAVLGPSGSGKSTLSKCVSLLERPTHGAIIVDGLDLTQLSEQHLRQHRRKIGTIFQASSLLSRRTVSENIALPLQYLGVTASGIQKRVSELLENVGLTDRAHHYPGQLSGGQKQRVGIARALALKPQILLADEATSGLDPDTTSSILKLINRLKDELSLSVILITHEMDVVRQVADHVAVLSAGKIIEQGSIHALIANPSSQIGKQLLPLQYPKQLPTQYNIFEITYLTETLISKAWLSQLSQQFSADFQILAANIEDISSRVIGRVLLAFRGVNVDLVSHTLHEWQFHHHIVQRESLAPSTFKSSESVVEQSLELIVNEH